MGRSEDARAALVARRKLHRPTANEEVVAARVEAHRVLRLGRGAEAVGFCIGAVSAVVEPHLEFDGPGSWRVFLERLYPAWAVEVGVRLFEPDARGFSQVVLALAEPPRRRWRRRVDGIDVRWLAAQGQVGIDGIWKGEPDAPLPESRPPDPRADPDVRDRFPTPLRRLERTAT